jgi:LL-diaminopimelate aminotransferase
MRFAERMAALPPYVFDAIGRELARRRAAGEDIIDLGISDPDIPPAPRLVERLTAEAHREASHRYPPYQGTYALREAVAAWYRRRFQVSVDPDRDVLITQGSKEALVHLALAVVNPGDVVLVPDPGYPAYAMAAWLSGATPVSVPLAAERGFLADLEAVPRDVARRVRLVYLNYPNNPTGRVAPPEAWQAWVDWCRAYDVLLVADLAYVDIVYAGRATSALGARGGRTVTVESLTWSKSYSMQGWRVGALVGQPDVLSAIRRVESNINAGVFLPIQAAATEALAGDPGEAVVSRYRDRRDFAVGRLRSLGFRVGAPEAAVYCWVEAPGGDGDRFAAAALDAGVAVTPGSAFGPLSRPYFRISLTHGLKELDRGLARLGRVAVPV